MWRGVSDAQMNMSPNWTFFSVLVSRKTTPPHSIKACTGHRIIRDALVCSLKGFNMKLTCWMILAKKLIVNLHAGRSAIFECHTMVNDTISTGLAGNLDCHIKSSRMNEKSAHLGYFCIVNCSCPVECCPAILILRIKADTFSEGSWSLIYFLCWARSHALAHSQQRHLFSNQYIHNY